MLQVKEERILEIVLRGLTEKEEVVLEVFCLEGGGANDLSWGREGLPGGPGKRENHVDKVIV